MLLVYPHPDSVKEDKLLIVAQESYQGHVESWRATIEYQHLEADDHAQMRALIADAVAGKAGVRQMACRCTDAIWAHGSGSPNEPFPVVIMPYERIIARAVEAEQYVLRETVRGLQITGVLLLVVIAVVIVVARRRARSLSRPIRRLAEAGQRLADGDFEARVDIQTGGELQALGEVFNETGPKLAERERMKQSLALAMEVRQHLLPHGSPSLPGFDI
ncbi:MAG: HAMP domain-containing protein, partial [Candidatus Brocadiae bacterium]|nr:HAMP domain-containing protein [Candidatus Brocadiia bacterium]